MLQFKLKQHTWTKLTIHREIPTQKIIVNFEICFEEDAENDSFNLQKRRTVTSAHNSSQIMTGVEPLQTHTTTKENSPI